MSVVGLRPPLRREVEAYELMCSRRLLVKPGVTGLWKVSRQSDLSWDKGVRLDLSYVDNLVDDRRNFDHCKDVATLFQCKEPTEVRCRLCDLNRLLSVLDLGPTQLYEKFLTADELALSPEF